MKKPFKRIVIAALLFFAIALNSQSTSKSSLHIRELENQISKHYRNSDSLQLFANKLLEYSKKQHYYDGEFKAYVVLGNAQRMNRNLKESNAYYYKGLSLAKKNLKAEDENLIMNNIALNHRRLRRNDSAFYYFKKVSSFYTANNFKMPSSMAKMNLGISFLQYQELDSALFYINESIIGFKKLNHSRFVAQNFSLLAEINYQKQYFDKALRLVDSSQSISQEINFKANYARNYGLLSRIYGKLGETDKANEYLMLERKFKPTRINTNGVRSLNEKYGNEIRNKSLKRVNELKKDTAFFKTNLIIIFWVVVLLIVVIYLLVKRNKKIKMEVIDLQNRLSNFKFSSKEESLLKDIIIHLKSKALIHCNDIIYVKSDGHYVEFYLKGKKKPEIDRRSLTDVIQLLPTSSFLRIHKSYVVNIHHIKIINSTKVMLDSGDWINLSRTYKQQLKDILNKK